MDRNCSLTNLKELICELMCVLVQFVVQLLSHVWLFATPQTAAHQAPLYMRFFRQGYWSGLPFPSPEDLPNPGIKPRSPALQADSLPTKLQGKPKIEQGHHYIVYYQLVVCINNDSETLHWEKTDKIQTMWNWINSNLTMFVSSLVVAKCSIAM